MKFNREPVSQVTIRQVEQDAIRVGNELFRQNFALTHLEPVRDWVPPDTDELTAGDVERIVGLDPEIVILGCGWSQRRPPNEFVFALARHGIGVETMETGAACRTFNILLSEGRRLVALMSL